MRKLLFNYKYQALIGFMSLVYLLWYSYAFFLESDGCFVSDIPFLVANPTQLAKNYCGDVEAFTFLPNTLNAILSIVLNIIAWVSIVGSFLLPIGIVRAIIGYVKRG
jgi:amino acid permease